ncbi:MAG: outer membrane beta-barrel protein [Lutibacter sp.]|uniref:outer membrane beta-barrel protein n=1 Tax=Lutibacter sp. TaxID=1925666 RepID=UPI00299F070E|nr:outer membrane beta-barrel protein [Lutibacter sp.]MDX1830440.1 outer membrane beta-barrel protein [Lutibacter sp.]
MKRKILLGLLLFIITIKTFSQNSKLSIELNYPFLIDNNFIGENYSGIIDFGIGYNFLQQETLNINIIISGAVMKTNKSSMRIHSTESNVSILKPKIAAELNIKKLNKIHPFVGLGYTFLFFKTSEKNYYNPEDLESSSLTQNESGFSLNFGMTYDITDRLFIKGLYDFTKLGTDSEVPNIKYNTKINIIKVGLGFRL